MDFVYFSLRTNTEEEKKTTNKIIKDLKNTFGKENVEVTNYDMWKSVGINGVRGWVGINDWAFGNGSRFHIYCPCESGKKECYDIPLECCDTIYNM